MATYFIVCVYHDKESLLIKSQVFLKKISET